MDHRAPLRAYGLCAALVTLFGCAGTTQVDARRVSEIERIAIIGFEGRYDVRDPAEGSKSGWTQAANAIADVTRDASGEEDKQLRQALNHSYDRLVRVVASATGTEVVLREELVSNAGYKDEWGRLGPTPGYDLTTADGVIGYSHLMYSGVEQRDRLMDALQVDAVAIANIRWVTGKVDDPNALTKLATGKQRLVRPAAWVSLTVWRKGEVDPAWNEKGVIGCPTESGIPDLHGFSLTPDMAPLLQQATDNGYHALVNRYREAMASEDGTAGATSMKGLVSLESRCG